MIGEEVMKIGHVLCLEDPFGIGTDYPPAGDELSSASEVYYPLSSVARHKVCPSTLLPVHIRPPSSPHVLLGRLIRQICFLVHHSASSEWSRAGVR